MKCENCDRLRSMCQQLVDLQAKLDEAKAQTLRIDRQADMTAINAVELLKKHTKAVEHLAEENVQLAEDKRELEEKIDLLEMDNGICATCTGGTIKAIKAFCEQAICAPNWQKAILAIIETKGDPAKLGNKT